MAAGKIDAEQRLEPAAPFTRNTFTTCGPFSFIRQTRKVLQEVQEKKESLCENFALDLRPAQTLEFYEVIDSLPGNDEMLEVLRIKQLVRDNIQSADKEIQDLIKQQLKNEAKQSESVDLRQNTEENDTNQNTLPSSTILQGSSSSSMHPQEQVTLKNKPVKFAGHAGTATTKGKPVIDTKRKFQHGLKGNRHSVAGFKHALSSKSSLISVKSTSEDQTADALYSQTIEEVNIPGNATLPQKKQTPVIPNFSIRNHEVSHCLGVFSERSKYFPSAVPLAPPSRQKSHESVVESVDKPGPAVDKMPPNLTRRPNVAVVTIQSPEVSKKHLTYQALPSISIEGKSKGSNFQRINVKNILFQEELSKENVSISHPGNLSEARLSSFVSSAMQNGGSELHDFQMNSSVSQNNHSDSRQDSKLCYKTESPGFQKILGTDVEIEEESQEILENIILDTVCEDLLNVCNDVKKDQPHMLLESNLKLPKEKEICDVEVQVQNSLIELVDQGTQATTERPVLISESIQTSLSAEQIETVSTSVQVSHSLEPSTEELPQIAPAVATADVSIQTSLEVHNEEPDFQDESLQKQLAVNQSNGVSHLDLRLSPPTATSEQDLKRENDSLPSLQAANAEEQEHPDCSLTDRGGIVLPSSETPEIQPDKVVPQHVLVESDLDKLPQKEQRSDVVQKMSDSEPSVSEKASKTSVTASTTMSDHDFTEDFLSEGECVLHSHLGLLSLIGREMTSMNSKRSQEKEAHESSLSEGEIPARYFNIFAAANTLNEGNATSVISKTDQEKEASDYSLSEGEIPIRKLNRLCDGGRNLTTFICTDKYEESVPEKLTAERSPSSSNDTLCHCNSTISEGQIYPCCAECRLKNEPCHQESVDEHQGSIARWEKEAVPHTVLHHSQQNSCVSFHNWDRNFWDRNVHLDPEIHNEMSHLHPEVQYGDSESRNVCETSKNTQAGSGVSMDAPVQGKSSYESLTEELLPSAVTLPQIMREIKGFQSSRNTLSKQ